MKFIILQVLISLFPSPTPNLLFLITYSGRIWNVNSLFHSFPSVIPVRDSSSWFQVIFTTKSLSDVLTGKYSSLKRRNPSFCWCTELLLCRWSAAHHSDSCKTRKNFVLNSTTSNISSKWAQKMVFSVTYIISLKQPANAEACKPQLSSAVSHIPARL